MQQLLELAFNGGALLRCDDAPRTRGEGRASRTLMRQGALDRFVDSRSQASTSHYHRGPHSSGAHCALAVVPFENLGDCPVSLVQRRRKLGRLGERTNAELII